MLPILPLLVFILLVALVIAWIGTFADLMRLADSDFPGRYDKILWCAAFLVLPLGAIFAFRRWRQAHNDEHKRG